MEEVLDILLEEDPINIESNEEGTIEAEDYPFKLSLRRTEISDEKELKNFIKGCEAMVRHSAEYKLWCEYIKEALGYKSCCVTKESCEDLTVEIHHHPYTMYDLVEAVIARKIASGKQFSSFDVSLEVIELHFNMRAPFCLLAKSIHEMYHRGNLSIPMTLIKGDYNYFFNNYLSFLDHEKMDYINQKLGINDKNCGWEIRWIKRNSNIDSIKENKI